MDRRLGGPQSRSGQRGENFWPYRDSNSDPSPVHLVASRYINYAIPAPIITLDIDIIFALILSAARSVTPAWNLVSLPNDWTAVNIDACRLCEYRPNRMYLYWLLRVARFSGSSQGSHKGVRAVHEWQVSGSQNLIFCHFTIIFWVKDTSHSLSLSWGTASKFSDTGFDQLRYMLFYKKSTEWIKWIKSYSWRNDYAMYIECLY
jgi:hypothetical protein